MGGKDGIYESRGKPGAVQEKAAAVSGGSSGAVYRFV